MSEKPDRRRPESHSDSGEITDTGSDFGEIAITGSDFGEIAITGSDFGEITNARHSPKGAMPFLPLARWRERGPGGEGGTARDFPNPIMLTDPAIHPAVASSLPDSSQPGLDVPIALTRSAACLHWHYSQPMFPPKPPRNRKARP